jgi:hypothetical protein
MPAIRTPKPTCPSPNSNRQRHALIGGTLRSQAHRPDGYPGRGRPRERPDRLVADNGNTQWVQRIEEPVAS